MLEMAVDDAPSAPVDRSAATGSIGLVLLVALVLVGTAVFLLFVGRDQAEPYILAVLASLAVIGVFALFAGAAGIVEFAGRAGRNDLTRAVIDSSPEGMSIVDASGRVLYANHAYLGLTGANGPDDVRPLERLFTSDPEVSEAIYRLAQAAREGKSQQEEIRLAGTVDTALRWVRLRVRPLAKEGRLAKLVMWGIADISRERDRQENTFLELQHAIDFLDHAPSGFFSAEPSGKIVYLNATLAGWLGYDLAEVPPGGLQLGDLVQGPSAALLSGILPVPGEVKTEIFDVDLRKKNGEAVPVRLLHKVAFAGDGTAGASRTLVLSRARDTGDALRDAEARFARFFHNTPVAIATIARDGRIGSMNASFIRLFGTGEGAEHSIFSVVADADRAKFESEVRGALDAKSGMREAEVTLTTLKGEEPRSARFYITTVEAEDGEAAIVHAIDTTEQRALEAQFAQSQKMQAVGQLAGGVAHDFNNVLTAIIGYSDLLLANHRPTDPSFQDLMQIKQNANRAAGLVRQLLAFSRRQTMRPQMLQLGDVLSDLSTGLLKRIIGETVKLDVKHGRDLWPIKADLNQFEQVVVNLAVNARDAMPGGGTLSIATRNISREGCAEFGERLLVPADYVMVEVSDTGDGILPNLLDKIFEPFFTTKEVGKGTGLGLSTVYGIVKQTGGFIFADSTVGEGSTFRIFLPRHVPTAAEAEKKAAASEQRADLTGRGTVLLVEDETAVRAFAARALASRGYQVVEAGSGVEALAAMERIDGEVDLVVSDVVMPEMDGPTLLRELRQKRPDLKVIFISGYAEGAFKKNLPEGEHFTFLPKPFSLKDLVAAVKETMAS
jgi:two-component system cell cycle sensor histidine kinase/response regulator CckA